VEDRSNLFPSSGDERCVLSVRGGRDTTSIQPCFWFRENVFLQQVLEADGGDVPRMIWDD